MDYSGCEYTPIRDVKAYSSNVRYESKADLTQKCGTIFNLNMSSTILDVSLFRKYAQVLYIDKLMRSLWRQKYLSPSW